MSWQGQGVLALVPARAGSKGIPGKNLCEVGGLSLIGHAARVLAPLAWIDARVLSTDAEAIAEEGRRHGLDTPFLRPAELAGDTADSISMWRHAWLASEDHYGRRFDLSVLVQPTTPLRRPDDIERCLRCLVAGGHRAAATISRVPGHFTPEKILTLDERDCVRPYLETGGVSRRQDSPAYYYRNGACYAVTRETLVERRQLTEFDCAGVLMEGFVINIDEPYELTLADLLYRNGLDR